MKLVEILFKRFSPHLYVAYGLTDMGLVAVAAPEMTRRHPCTAGRMPPDIEAKVVDEGERHMPPGRSGILRLRAKVMLQGYCPDNGLTAERFKNGWYYPRDIAHVNERFALHRGQARRRAQRRGAKVQFSDVEQVLEAHPGIREAAVFVAVDSEGREKMGVAYISSDGSAIAGLDAYAQEKLGPLRPGESHSSAGKVPRDRLRNLYIDGTLR